MTPRLPRGQTSIETPEPDDDWGDGPTELGGDVYVATVLVAPDNEESEDD